MLLFRNVNVKDGIVQTMGHLFLRLGGETSGVMMDTILLGVCMMVEIVVHLMLFQIGTAIVV